ncbi:hypothetical protein ACGFNV_15425 [Streptomyces sp. NPDC048751]|uniref:hypothetical protein n=1 Tax=Streptomyces sp. NPDC048751 TaxID=3365591 RepID=UPI00371EA508
MPGSPPATSARLRTRAVTALVLLAALLFGALPAEAATYVPISGAGSTWSQNALDQWRANVKQYGAQKGKTLSAFAYYFLCQGQQRVDSLGYSPLPINLVQAGLNQVRRIPGADVERINIKARPGGLRPDAAAPAQPPLTTRCRR